MLRDPIHSTNLQTKINRAKTLHDGLYDEDYCVEAQKIIRKELGYKGTIPELAAEMLNLVHNLESQLELPV